MKLELTLINNTIHFITIKTSLEEFIQLIEFNPNSVINSNDGYFIVVNKIIGFTCAE